MLESTHLHSPCHSTLGPFSRSLGQDCKVTGNKVSSASQVGMAIETASLSEACSVVSFDVANARTDQSLLKSQRVFEVKSPEVQILAYSTTCPSNINSLHPVPQLAASCAGNFFLGRMQTTAPWMLLFLQKEISSSPIRAGH